MNFGEELCQFIQDCPTPFQFVQVATQHLLKSGYTKYKLGDEWPNIPRKGFFIRNKRALIAFNSSEHFESGIIVGTHCDSPVLRLKKRLSDQKNAKSSTVECTEYGWANLTRWVDRPLRLSGCVKLKNKRIVPFDSKESVAILTSENLTFSDDDDENYEENLRPIFGLPHAKTLIDYISEKLGIDKTEIVSHELSFVDAYPPKLIGCSKSLLSSQRIDNLTSTFSALKAFLQSSPNNTLNVLVVFDFEEEGSEDPAGAEGDFLAVVLKKLLRNDLKKYNNFISKSLFVSSDNAQAIHPNYMKLYDSQNSPSMGNGVSVKKSPEDSYATDLFSSYPLKKAAEKAGVNLQVMINRNDIPSGSTIGPIVSTSIGIPTVDIGQPQLAMHSIRELVAVKDVEDNMKLLIEIYNNYDNFRLK